VLPLLLPGMVLSLVWALGTRVPPLSFRFGSEACGTPLVHLLFETLAPTTSISVSGVATLPLTPVGSVCAASMQTQQTKSLSGFLADCGSIAHPCQAPYVSFGKSTCTRKRRRLSIFARTLRTGPSVCLQTVSGPLILSCASEGSANAALRTPFLIGTRRRKSQVAGRMTFLVVPSAQTSF
jgi:hypothetical protein